MKFTQIPSDTFKKLQLNAGVLATAFEPSTGTLTATNVIGATTGGISFEATPEFEDFGEDIDNCPKNTMELKKLTSWEVVLSGTFVTMDTAVAKSMTGAADIDGSDHTKVVPRNDVDVEKDFSDIWFVGDYSDGNTGKSAGFIAIRVINALSTGGFKLQTTDKGKGNFEFEYTGHYSMSAQGTVPFEVYVKAGGAEK